VTILSFTSYEVKLLHVLHGITRTVFNPVCRCIVEQLQNGTTSQSSEIHSGDPKQVKEAA
jgi:hypothetical protein